MKTKQQSPKHGLAEMPAGEKFTIRLPELHAQLLKASAAFDGQTPEQYALAALRSCLECSAEAIGHALK